MAKIAGIVGGIISLILAFIYEIPLSVELNLALNFKIYSMQGTDFYFWGFISGTRSFTHITRDFPENIPAFLIWVTIFSIGVSMIMASTKNAIPENSLRLYLMTIFLIIVILIFYGIGICISIVQEFKPISDTIGLGYYLTFGILILDIIAYKMLKNKSMIDIRELFS